MDDKIKKAEEALAKAKIDLQKAITETFPTGRQVFFQHRKLFALGTVSAVQEDGNLLIVHGSADDEKGPREVVRHYSEVRLA